MHLRRIGASARRPADRFAARLARDPHRSSGRLRPLLVASALLILVREEGLQQKVLVGEWLPVAGEIQASSLFCLCFKYPFPSFLGLQETEAVMCISSPAKE